MQIEKNEKYIKRNRFILRVCVCLFVSLFVYLFVCVFAYLFVYENHRKSLYDNRICFHTIICLGVCHCD